MMISSPMSTVGSPSKKTFQVPEPVKEWFDSGRRGDGIPPAAVRDWMGEVVRTHYRVFYSIAYGFVHNRTTAEDLVQNAVMKALQAITKLKEPDSVVGWLAAITRNSCFEEFRRKKGKWDEPVETAVGLESVNNADVNLFETQHLVLQAIESLPENQAIVIRLRFLEDLDLDEIAERVGLRKNTVEVRIHRALAALAKNSRLLALKGESQ
jgi:RNA polymerase sigma-70 factor, ECF subfamily